MFRKALREFFMLSRGEQRAMIIVSLLLILSLAARITVHVLPAREPSGMEEILKESRRIIAALEEADSLRLARQSVADSIGNTSNSNYHRRVYRSNPTYGFRNDTPSIININAADSTDLLPLPGIGPVFAGRIIRYRNMLGGYVNTDQLSEVYGLSRETIQMIIPLIQIDTLEVRRLHVNRAAFRELLKHPYLEYEDVKAIMKYLDMAGPLSSLHELRQNMVLADSTLDKIKCYIDFSQ